MEQLARYQVLQGNAGLPSSAWRSEIIREVYLLYYFFLDLQRPGFSQVGWQSHLIKKRAKRNPIPKMSHQTITLPDILATLRQHINLLMAVTQERGNKRKFN